MSVTVRESCNVPSMTPRMPMTVDCTNAAGVPTARLVLGRRKLERWQPLRER
jgi:hypothetical protein